MKRISKALIHFLVTAGIVFLLGVGLRWWLGSEAALSLPGITAQRLQAVLSWRSLLEIAGIAGLFAMCWGFVRKSAAAKLVLVLLLCLGLGYTIYEHFPEAVEEVKIVAAKKATEDRVAEAEKSLEYPNAQKFEYAGLPPIQVVTETPVSQEWMDNIAYNAIAKMPRFLTEKAKAIVFMDEASFTPEREEFDIPDVVGLANSANMSVKILIQDFPGQYQDTAMPEYIMDPIDYYINTLAHELSHLYDYQYAYNQDFLSDKKEFQELYETYKDSLNDYASSGIKEFFAEASKLYLFYPDYLAGKSYPVYEYFDAMYRPLLEQEASQVQ